MSCCCKHFSLITCAVPVNTLITFLLVLVAQTEIVHSTCCSLDTDVGCLAASWLTHSP